MLTTVPLSSLHFVMSRPGVYVTVVMLDLSDISCSNTTVSALWDILVTTHTQEVRDTAADNRNKKKEIGRYRIQVLTLEKGRKCCF